MPVGRRVKHYVQVWLPKAVAEIKNRHPLIPTTEAIRQAIRDIGCEATQNEVNAYKVVVDRVEKKRRAKLNAEKQADPKQTMPQKRPARDEEVISKPGATIRRHRGTYGGG